MSLKNFKTSPRKDKISFLYVDLNLLLKSLQLAHFLENSTIVQKSFCSFGTFWPSQVVHCICPPVITMCYLHDEQMNTIPCVQDASLTCPTLSCKESGVGLQHCTAQWFFFPQEPLSQSRIMINSTCSLGNGEEIKSAEEEKENSFYHSLYFLD